MHFWELRKYDDGSFVVTESDKDGSSADYKRKFVGKGMSRAWRCFRHCIMGTTCQVIGCERVNCERRKSLK